MLFKLRTDRGIYGIDCELSTLFGTCKLRATIGAYLSPTGFSTEYLSKCQVYLYILQDIFSKCQIISPQF